MQIQSVVLGGCLTQNWLTYWFLSDCKVKALGLVKYQGLVAFHEEIKYQVIEEIDHTLGCKELIPAQNLGI